MDAWWGRLSTMGASLLPAMYEVALSLSLPADTSDRWRIIFLEAHFSTCQKTAAFSSSNGVARAQGFNSDAENHIDLEQEL